MDNDKDDNDRTNYFTPCACAQGKNDYLVCYAVMRMAIDSTISYPSDNSYMHVHVHVHEVASSPDAIFDSISWLRTSTLLN